jgi:hypothetical protein
MQIMRSGLAAMTAVTLFTTAPAAALVTTYVTSGAFAAASSQTAFADFESEAWGYTANPLVSSGIRFTQLPGGHPNIVPYIAPAGGAGTIPEAQSQVLEANGDENFRIELASNASFNAIGFNLYTNAYDAPVISLYTPGGTLIGSYAVPQAPHTFGYFGLTSTASIGWAVMIVDRGWVENTAIDNVSIGGVPEPASWAMLIAGMGGVGLAMRRRRSGHQSVSA